MAALEAGVKGFLFDCRMCGDCVLSKTGMSCPMNCPKAMRNGPCGGVRVERQLRGLSRDALRLGKPRREASRMRGGGAIAEVLPPLDHARKGSSTWLRLARRKPKAEK